MRRSKWIALLVGLQLLAAVPMQAAAAQQAGTQAVILINEQVVGLKQKPVIIAGKTYVSVHDLAKILQGEAKIEKGKTSLRVGLEIVSYQPEPGVNVPYGYMPLRLVAEKNGYKVSWNAQKQAVYLTKDKKHNPADGFVPVDATDLTSEEKAFVDENRTTAGVHKLGNLYMISLGSKPNPGYGIEFVKNVQSWEQLFVHVKLTGPEPGKMYPQVIAYPYLLGRAELPAYTTMLVIDDETNEQLFTEK